MQSNAESAQLPNISKNYLQVPNVFREALEAKKTPIGDSLGLLYGKAFTKEALLRLIGETDDIAAKAELTVMYLSLAEFQDHDSLGDRELCYKKMVEESEKLLIDLRRLERE